jgi:hypothetical protein
MYSTSSTPPTEGLISRQCTWYIKGQVKVYLQHTYSCRGLFSKRFSQTMFITQVAQLFWENQLGTTGLPVRSSPDTQPHIFPENDSGHENFPNPNISSVTTPWLVQYRGHGYSNRFLHSAEVVHLYPQVGYRHMNTSVLVRILSKPLPTLANTTSHHGRNQGVISHNQGVPHTDRTPTPWSSVAHPHSRWQVE